MPRLHLSDLQKAGVVGVLTLLVVGFWGYILTVSPSPDKSSSASAGAQPSIPQQSTEHLRADFVGDGFTAPTPEGGSGNAGYPHLLAARYGWRLVVAASDDTGFLHVGASGKSLPELAEQTVGDRPDVLVVFGGRADVGRYKPEDVGTAAGTLVSHLHTELPAARLVVVGPVATDAVAPPGSAEVRDAVAASVRNTPGTDFIDPLAEGWFNAAPAGAIGSDGKHPTDEGHRIIADRLEADLTRLGVGQPAPLPSGG